MRIMLAQINPIVGDFSYNTEKIVKIIEEAKKSSVEMVVFSELAICGYFPGDLLLMPEFIEKGLKALDEIIAASKDIAVIVGVARNNSQGLEKKLFNSAAVIVNQELKGFQDKTLLPTYDVFDERRYFEPAQELKVWKIFGYDIAITICEDLWQHSGELKETKYRKDPILELSSCSVDVVVNISASPYSLCKAEKRFMVCSTAAKSIKAPLVLCNQVGANDSLIFDGRSLYCNASGELLACGKSFAEDCLVVDLKAEYKPIFFEFSPSEELFEALVLGVRDYFHKLGFKKACIGLSGGIDSAVVACIAAKALGAENVLGISMPSRYSSEGSIVDAEKLAANLKISLKTIAIEKPFQCFLDILEPEFVGQKADVTEENLQARIRGVIAMAMSNKFGYIMLSTGNKSELAMGYATLYGDMCGGLSVIGDVTKLGVYAIAEWINKEQEIIPSATITKPPSAELRLNQKDSDSLPDYHILDVIVQAYVENLMTASQIAEKFEFPLSVVKDVIVRIHNNEYKRQQGALVLKVSEKAFSVGRQFPIVERYASID